MNTEQKRGRGRPKNSKSFSNLTLAELNQRFKQDDIISVGSLFLKNGEILRKKDIEASDKIVRSMTENVFIVPTTETSVVEMTLQA